jgi:hypothetical protein
MEECVVEFDRLHALDRGRQPLIPGSRIYFKKNIATSAPRPTDPSQARDGAATACADFDLLLRVALFQPSRPTGRHEHVIRGSTPLLLCRAVLCVDRRVSQVKAVLCNGIENCPYDFPLRRAPVRLQRHASFKPPTYLRINSRRKDVAAGIGRERVKPAFAAAEQVDRLCQRHFSSRPKRSHRA